MSNQIVISSGAKVRELEGVLTGTAGIVNALGINVPSGIPQLDGSGKILVSQLPNSVMEFKGTWNAATNTPTLVNGTGNAGDVYLCNVAGTVNFGAGPITFAVGDQVLYSGTTWQRASGATGTVTSVSVTESGDALSITGSPITTSGTINIGFAGTSGQYINGAGGLTTFPDLSGFVTLGTTQTITGAKTFSTFTQFDDSIYANANIRLANVGTSSITLLQNTNTAGIVSFGANMLGFNTNKDLYISSDGKGYSVLAFNNSGTGYTYTLPALSGTIALTSNLGSYVPYTGATANVNLGTFDLTADVITGATGSFTSSGSGNTLTINHSSGSGHGIDITKAGSGEGIRVNKTSGSGNAATIIGTLNATTLVKSGGTSSQFLMADGSVNTSVLPSGAYVTLATTQTISGSKTFSATTLLNTIYVDGVSYLKHQTTTSFITGYTTFSAKANGVIEYFFPSSFKSVLDFNDGADYTYTFPALTGTIALTSNLSAYLPLAGGTLTGALSGTSATFSGNLGYTSGSALYPRTTSVNNWYLNKHNAAIDRIDNAVGNNNAFTIGIDSSGTYTPNIFFFSGGSATFSSSVNVGGAPAINDLNIYNTNNAGISFNTSYTGTLGNDGFYMGQLFQSTNFLFRQRENADIIFETNNGSERMRITSGGNVGIGTSSPSYKLDVGGASNTDSTARFFKTGEGALLLGGNRSTSNCPFIGSENNYDFAFIAANVERARFASGYFKASNNGVYFNLSSSSHEFNQSNNNWLLETRNSSGTPYGMIIRYSGATPNNTTSEYLYFDDASAVRVKMLSNGGLANFQANNTNLSDERTKKDIIPLESYWDKFKAIEIVKFKYKDQTHDDFNIGVIAQQLEEVAPEFIDADGWDNKPKLDEDGNEIISDEEPLKSIYTADLYHATIKVLQEAMARIESQDAKIEELKALIAAK